VASEVADIDASALTAPTNLHLRRTLLPSSRVRELSVLRPRRAAADLAWNWAIIVAAWLVAARVGAWPVTVLAAAVVGNRFYSLFIIGHDGLHRRLHPDQRRSDLLSDLFVMAPIGAITRLNNRNHLLHHQHLATEADPDRFKHFCFNKRSRLELVGYVTSATSVATTVAHVFNRRREEPAAPARPATGRPAGRRGPRDLALLLAVHATLLVVLTLLFGWWGYLAMWWVPVFCFTFLADNLRTFAEHGQATSDAEADRARLITNRPGWLERQLLAPMNMHLHAAHHLWPSIPYYNLPLADAELQAHPEAAAIEQRGSYLAFVRRFARGLPYPGCGAPA
jgi:fatty acid desaturase